MAERTLTVALRAAVQGYTASMGRAAAATGTLEGSLARTQRAGMATARVGDMMTSRVTLPIVALGAAAVKMATDFDNEMTRMQTLAGVTAEEVDSMRGSIMDLAGETGQAPKELAEAMFFIQSAGISGAEAVEVLDRSARAAALGLGTTKDMADLLTGAMQIYGSETLSATSAMDIFAKGVENSKTDVDSFAESVISVIPQADALGVSFLDVNAALATMAATNSNMSENATQLRGLFTQLTTITPQFESKLSEVNVSASALQDIMGEEGGLVDGLMMLWEAVDGDSRAFAQLFPNVEAAKGALSILAQEGDLANDVLTDMQDHAGQLDNSFSIWAETMGAQNAQAFGQMQVAMIELGDVILPIANQIVGRVTDLVDAFSSLPGPVQEGVVWVGLMAAAAGPLLSVGGRLVTTIGRLGTAMSNFAVPSGAVSGAFQSGTRSGGRFRSNLRGIGLAAGWVGATLGASALVLDNWNRAQNEASDAAERWAEAIREAGGDLEGTAAEVIASDDHWSRLRDRIHETGIEVDLFTDAIEGPRDELQEVTDAFNEFSGSVGRDRFGPTIDALEELADGGNDLAAALLDVVESGDMSGEQLLVLARDLLDANEAGARANEIFEAQEGVMEGAGDAADGMSDSQRELASEMEAAGVDVEALGEDFDSLTDAVQQYNDALTALFDPQFAMVDALRANEDAARAVDDAEQALTDAINEHGSSSDEAAEAQRNLEDAHMDSVRSALDLESAANNLNAQIEAGEISVDDARAALDSWVDQGLISRDTADVMAFSFAGAAGKADELDGTRSTRFTTPGFQGAKARIDGIRDSVNSIPKVYPIDIRVNSNSAVATIDRLKGRRRMGGPVQAGEAYVVGEAGPEILISSHDGHVIPNHAITAGQPERFAAMPSMVMGGGTTVIKLYASDRLGRGVMESLRAEVRERGRGSVQLALGQGAA